MSHFGSEHYQNKSKQWELVLQQAELFNIEVPNLKKIERDQKRSILDSLIEQFQLHDFEEKEAVVAALKDDMIHWGYLLYQRDLAEQKLEKEFAEKGIEVHFSSSPDEDLRIYSVTLDFTPEEWVEIIQTEGEYLPACCAVISGIRDTLIGCLRDNSVIRCGDLFEIVDALKKHHDCDDSPNVVEEKLLFLWEAVKDLADVGGICGRSTKNINDIDGAFSTLYLTASSWCWEKMLGKEEEIKSCQLLYIQNLAPIISTIYRFVNEKCGKEPLRGYAIANLIDGQIQIVKLRNAGLAFYDTDDLERCIAFTKEVNLANEDRDENKNLENRFVKVGYVPFEINLGQQIKFLDNITYVD